jgi:alkylhydroperoxidase family enzyme
MTWIRTIAVHEAEGKLAELYRQAVQRAGRVFGIIRTMSLAPRVLEASMGLYLSVMFAHQGLSRRRREMIAVVVSRANDCHY